LKGNCEAWNLEQHRLDGRDNPAGINGDDENMDLDGRQAAAADGYSQLAPRFDEGDIEDPGRDNIRDNEDMDLDDRTAVEADGGCTPAARHAPMSAAISNESPVDDPAVHLENPPDEQEWEDVDDDDQPSDPYVRKAPTEDILGTRFVTIVDRSGIHHLPVLYCSCMESQPHDEQLLKCHLFPATFNSIATVFTFAVLDDFRLENLECKTTPYQYYQKLRRISNSAFPQTVANRYHELRRVSRQWRQLKKWKWHGIPYDSQKRGPGEMALFCPACPQPGVNLSPRWVEQKNK
jgi:hypothetical protein